MDSNLIACLIFFFFFLNTLGIKPIVIQFRFLKLKNFWIKKVSEYSYMFLLSTIIYIYIYKIEILL